MRLRPFAPAAATGLATALVCGLALPSEAHAAEPVTVTKIVDDEDGGTPQVVTARVSSSRAAEAWVDRAEDAPGTLAADEDVRRSLLGGAAPSLPAQRTAAAPARSNDYYRPLQWGLDRMRAESVRPVNGGAGVVVAVVDTGVDARHPDLAGRVLPGADFVSGRTDGRWDPEGHGTHVAGIIAATAGNRIGVAGMAPGVSILPVRVLDEVGFGYDSTIARGVIWAVDHGADIVNLSLGGPQPSSVLAAAVDYARRRGVLVVAAAGNSRLQGNPDIYPAAYPGVLAVGAVTSGDTAASFSESRSYVRLAAPGDRIASTIPGNGYAYRTGTSMAAPFVAAAAALVEASAGAVAPDALADALTRTAEDLGPRGRDSATGYGMPRPDQAAALLRTGKVSLSAPTRSTYGASFTVSGRAVLSTGATVPSPVVDLQRQAPGSSSWTRVATTTGSRSGSVSFKVRGTATTRYRLVLHSTGARTGATSTTRTVTVQGRASIKAASKRTTTTVAGSVLPKVRARVTLQYWNGRAWRTSATSYSSSKGSYTVRIKRHKGLRVRVVTASSRTRAGAVSAAVRTP